VSAHLAHLAHFALLQLVQHFPAACCNAAHISCYTVFVIAVPVDVVRLLTSSTALSLITTRNACTCLCRRMSLEDFRHVRRLIIRIILSTDMAAHHDSVDEFAASLRLWGPDLAAWAPDKRVVALQVGRTSNSLLACDCASCVRANNLRCRLAGCATCPGVLRLVPRCCLCVREITGCLPSPLISL
jgi:hypothetical protein